MPYSKPIITVDGQRLQVIDTFIYPRSALTGAVHINDDLLRLLPELIKPVWPFVVFVEMSSSGMESGLTLIRKATRL